MHAWGEQRVIRSGVGARALEGQRSAVQRVWGQHDQVLAGSAGARCIRDGPPAAGVLPRICLWRSHGLRRLTWSPGCLPPPAWLMQTVPCGVSGLGDVYKALLWLLPWTGGGGACARRIDYAAGDR